MYNDAFRGPVLRWYLHRVPVCWMDVKFARSPRSSGPGCEMTIVIEFRSALSMRRIIRIFPGVDLCIPHSASANSCAILSTSGFAPPSSIAASAAQPQQQVVARVSLGTKKTSSSALFSGFAPPTFKYSARFPFPPVSIPSSKAFLFGGAAALGTGQRGRFRGATGGRTAGVFRSIGVDTTDIGVDNTDIGVDNTDI